MQAEDPWNESSHQAGPITLPIAPWERYMAIDYGPHHSMTCLLRYWFQGEMDRQTWVGALEKVAQRNPFLSLQWTSKAWEVVPFDAETQVDWQPSTVPIELSHLSPSETRLRFIVRTGKLSELEHHDASVGEEIGALLLVKYPHSISDGHGISSIIHQLREQLSHSAGATDTAGDLDYRLNFGLTLWQRLARMRWDLGRILKYFRCRPMAFQTRTSSDHSIPSQPFCLERRVSSREWLAEVRVAAHARQVHVNDWLIAALFRSLAAAQPSGMMRMSIPTSMRPPNNLSVCNLVSMVFLDRHSRQTDNPRFLASIAEEMRSIKDRKLGHAMLSFLALATIGRGGLMKLFLKRSKTNVTAVLTNLGQPFREQNENRVGTWTLVSMDSIAPIRPGTNIMFSVNSFGERLSVSVRYEPRYVDSNAAVVLLDRFFAECESMIVC